MPTHWPCVCSLNNQSTKRPCATQSPCRAPTNDVPALIPFSSAAKIALERAVAEASRLGHNYIGPNIYSWPDWNRRQLRNTPRLWSGQRSGRSHHRPRPEHPDDVVMTTVRAAPWLLRGFTGNQRLMDADGTSQGETIATEKDVTVKPVEQDLEQQSRRFVEIYAEGWRAPRSADELVNHFTPWLTDDFRFTQPFLRGEGVGHAQFEERFARPMFTVMRNVHASVDSWANAGDMMFIAVTVTCTVGRHRVAFRGCDRLRLVDGKAAERHNYADVTPPSDRFAAKPPSVATHRTPGSRPLRLTPR